MLRIAICDDELEELAVIANYINEYNEMNHLDAEIRQFSHPDELMNVCDQERFHVYILDIVMPMINGIGVGREIRRLDREAQIIYATTEASFALEAFLANPINYLIKPIDKAQLFDTLTLAISKVNLDEESIISIKTKNGIRVIKLSSIVYCEYIEHAAVFALKSGECISSVSTRSPFGAFSEPLLRDKRFLQPHSSFVLNMSYVEEFSREGFTLHGKIVVPIAKSRYAEVRSLYMDYLFVREEIK
jgi:Response regulator of the LytR/AlgR family